jgi:hypothetical protein
MTRALLLTLVLLLIVAGVASAAHYRGIAAEKGAEAERLTVVLAETRARVEAAEAEALAVVAETERQRAADSARIVGLNERVAGLAQSNAGLRDAAETELREHDDWLTGATHRAIVDNLDRTILVTDSLRQVEHDGRISERERGDALAVQVTALTAHVGVLEERDSVRVEHIAALESGGRWSLSFGSDAWKVGAGLIAGFLIAEAR